MESHKKNMVDEHLAMSLALITSLQNKITSLQNQVTAQQNKIISQHNRSTTLEKKLGEQTEEIKHLMASIEINKKPSTKQKLKIPLIKQKLRIPSPILTRKQETEEPKVYDIFKYNWKVEEFERKYKSGQDIHSESFYTTMGYNVQLAFRKWDDRIGIYLLLRKGQEDDSMTWPFLNIYRLSLINQEDKTNDNLSRIWDPKQDDDSEQQKYYRKPIKEHNDI